MSLKQSFFEAYRRQVLKDLVWEIYQDSEKVGQAIRALEAIARPKPKPECGCTEGPECKVLHGAQQ